MYRKRQRETRWVVWVSACFIPMFEEIPIPNLSVTDEFERDRICIKTYRMQSFHSKYMFDCIALVLYRTFSDEANSYVPIYILV